MSARFSMVWAGVFGFAGVALGAFGAHGLHDNLLRQGMLQVWETAVNYQLVHTVGLLALAVWSRTHPSRPARWAIGCWTAGIILFSGSLYALALGGPRWLGPITPLGGLALLAGWIFVVAAGLTKPPAPQA